MPLDTALGYVSALWQFLRSLRLTIALFLILAAASILGTLVPQNIDLPVYERMYGAFAARFIFVLGITDLFHCAWFIALIALLVLNLIACSVHRFPSTWKAVQAPQRPLTDAMLERLSFRRTCTLGEPARDAVPKMQDSLKKGRWSVGVENKNGATHLMAQKGRYGRMGVYVTHLGVVLILIGALIGFLWGFKGFIRLFEGQSVAKVQSAHEPAFRDLGFRVRCDRYSMTNYEDGTIKEYRSDLTVLEGDKEVLKKSIRVNHPMSYGGFVFYQSSFGGHTTATIEATEEATGAVKRIKIEEGGAVDLDPQGALKVRVLEYDPDRKSTGPALLIALLRPNDHPVGGWIAKEETTPAFQGWSVKFVEAEQHFWTGIQVKKDPGTWVVWVGCGLMLIGCWLAFFVTPMKLWIRIPDDADAPTDLGASAPKGRHNVELAADKLCREWEQQGLIRTVDAGVIDG